MSEEIQNSITPTRNADVTSTISTKPMNIISSSFGHPLSTVLTVKLDENNYLLWRGMVLAILRGQKVDGYVLGTKERPSEFLNKTNEGDKYESLPNPLFEEWISVDQALSGWLFGSMTPSIAADVVNLTTS